MEAFFAGMISRLDSMNDLLSIFKIFAVFWKPFWGVFWDNYAKKRSMEKESKKESEKRAQAWRFAAEAGVSGGGEASPRIFARSFTLLSSTPCYL